MYTNTGYHTRVVLLLPVYTEIGTMNRLIPPTRDSAGKW